MKSNVRSAVCAAAMTCAGTIGVRADAVLTTVATHTLPRAIAIDSVTNKIYVADDSFVTVIDGATNSTTILSAGIGRSSNSSIVVNPVTNMVYVANKNGNSVTVINGATGSTAASVATTIGVGTSPVAQAVNPVTNMIYVANYGSNNVTVIDGANNFTYTVTVGTEPVAIAVNPVTDMTYVPNYGGTITIINGSNATATLTGGSEPFAVAVNSATDKIYVANYGTSGTNSMVTVINGATSSTAASVAATVSVGITPYSIAVDQVTNMVYVANSGSSFATAITGATNAATSITGAGMNCVAAAVNPATDIIYLANNSGTAVIINGATNSASSLTAGTRPNAVAVNQVTDMIYVANYSSANVTVISGPGPGQPVLSSPSNGATGQMTPLTLSWNSASGATSYTVQISTGSTFSTTVFAHSGAGLTATASGLAYGGITYYWRVGAVNASGTDWSSEWSFVTLTVPAAPVFVSPGNGSELNEPENEELLWYPVATATSYTCQFSTTSSFASTIVSQSDILFDTIIDPAYPIYVEYYTPNTVVTAAYNRKIYMHLNAANAAGTGPWSSVWYFSPQVSVEPRPMLNGNDNFSIKNGSIAYSLSKMEKVEMSICDILGRRALSIKRCQSAGSYSLDLKNSMISAGIYFVRFKAGTFQRQATLMLR